MCFGQLIRPTRVTWFDIVKSCMDYAEREATEILDTFLAYQGPDDLSLLQHAIAALLRRAYNRGADDLKVPLSKP